MRWVDWVYPSLLSCSLMSLAVLRLSIMDSSRIRRRQLFMLCSTGNSVRRVRALARRALRLVSQRHRSRVRPMSAGACCVWCNIVTVIRQHTGACVACTYEAMYKLADVSCALSLPAQGHIHPSKVYHGPYVYAAAAQLVAWR